MAWLGQGFARLAVRFFHVKNAAPGWVENHKWGDKAAGHVDATKRRSLNEGDDFLGSLIRRQVGLVFLYVGMHPVHGVSAVVDVPSSHRSGSGCLNNFPRFISGTPVGLQKVQSCPRRRLVACDEPTDAVGNSGRTSDFILRGLLHWWQGGQVLFIGRGAIQT